MNIMKCQECGCEKFIVTNTVKDDEGYIIRRRQCIFCGEHMITKEIPIDANSIYEIVGNSCRKKYTPEESDLCKSLKKYIKEANGGQ